MDSMLFLNSVISYPVVTSCSIDGQSCTKFAIMGQIYLEVGRVFRYSLNNGPGPIGSLQLR
ncbi:unnamed protein product [Ceratitis capitata]|uniref:(Mediterranean fruit fly) hypothetical protein n=1 Tax=Ceratitis capitata TaxID=7213 RepID=A0A811UBX1_CERCA|nr:unnamed protein product [Ceratitis capitata]